MKFMTGLLCALVLSGCATQKVQPWQRENLARPEMAWEPGLLQAGQRDHTFASKEAASGHAGLAGGGCGCN
jgi:hypothetical protein